MRKSKTKTISIKEEYYPVLDYLNTIKNASEYICELVRKDLESKNTLDELTKQLEAIQEEIKKIELNGNNDKPTA